MIGNTERGPDAIAAIREFQSVYLIAVGGAAYLISKAIHSARVLAFADLGMEAIYEFDVVDMPVTVAVDSLGTSVHTTGPAPPSGNPASPSTSPTPPSCNNPPALPRRLNGTKASEFDPGDRIPSMPPQRSWKEAIVAVLQDAQEPLSAADIVQEIVKRGLKTDFGATPAATVGAQIYISIKSDGAASPFARPVPGRFVLREQQQTLESSTASKDLSEKGPQEGTSQISGVVNALGMFWERSKVDWKISQTRLLGHQPSGIDVDFNAQRGIYLLHDAQGVVYVGRVTDQPLGMRLRQHTIDRLNGRWDRFSWFGVFPVAENGMLRTDADFSMTSINSVIAAMEAVLIEALEPRLNRKRGDTSFDPIEFLQSEDPKMELKRKLEIIEELTAKMKGN